METRHLPLLGLAGLILGACATPFRAPPDVAHVRLELGDSPVVRVDKIWLERKGPLVLRGYVVKRLAAEDTTGTHLDVTIYDPAGNVLRTTVEQFEPRQISTRFRRADAAKYYIVLDPLPAGTFRIRVQAHEGKHL